MQSYLLSERFHTFYFKTLEIENYNSLSLIVQTVLMLHNGSEIERGFSTNKETLKDNMSEMTLVSRAGQLL